MLLVERDIFLGVLLGGWLGASGVFWMAGVLGDEWGRLGRVVGEREDGVLR